MSDPLPGDIGLVAVSGLVGPLIRVGQGWVGDGFGPYQHAFVCLGGGEVVQGMPSGAERAPLPPGAVYLRCPPELGEAVTKAAIGLIGTPYSFTDYAAIALHRLRVPIPHLRGYIESSGRLICSALCDRAAELGGWHLFDDRRWRGYVTPGALWQLWKQQQISSA